MHPVGHDGVIAVMQRLALQNFPRRKKDAGCTHMEKEENSDGQTISATFQYGVGP
jgi:hypothetical protein